MVKDPIKKARKKPEGGADMKRIKKIPKFKSEKEEAAFWSKHSPLDYPEEFKEVEKPFQFDKDFLKEKAREHKKKRKQ